MRLQPDAYRRYREAYQRGRLEDVVRDGDALAATLDREPKHRPFVPAVALMKGSALAQLEAFADATTYLEYGLARYEEDDDTHLRELGDGDWFALRLVELQTVLGRYGDAWTRLTALEDPGRSTATRLAAIRGRAALNTIRGDYEGAHQLLNAAVSVTDRIKSTYLVTLVEADRITVLAMQGRLREAISLADRTLDLLARPTTGSRGAWSAQETAAVALTLSRLCVEGDRLDDGERFLLLGTAAAERAGTRYLAAQVDVAISTLWRAQGSAGSAEPLCGEATQTFAVLGCRPAEAQATLELAKLAIARGLLTSARPLLERARDELRFLGHARDLRDAERLLAETAPDEPVDDRAFRPPVATTAPTPTPPPNRLPGRP